MLSIRPARIADLPRIMTVLEAAKGISKISIVLLLCLAGCSSGWTPREKQILSASDSLMYVTVLQADSTILRTPSAEIGARLLRSGELATLKAKMLRTVMDPSQDGVGIAAPQVGINRRAIWVQRFDKPGEPFEFYVDVRIDSTGGEIFHGPEGCMSVPPMRGIVPRHGIVHVSYLDPDSGGRASETVEGYTAIIFQHECDHLGGILYIDRADSIFVSEAWAAEREAYNYDRPEWW